MPGAKAAKGAGSDLSGQKKLHVGGAAALIPRHYGNIGAAPLNGSDELDVFGRYLVLDGEEAGHLDDELLLARAADSQQLAFVAVHDALAHKADLFAVREVGKLVGGVIFRGVGSGGRGDKSFHFAGAYGHGLTICGALDEPILQCIRFINKGVEFVARGVHEQEVMDDRRLATRLAARDDAHHPFHGSEYLETGLLHAHVSGQFGDRTRQVAQYEPLLSIGRLRSRHDVKMGSPLRFRQ